MNNGAVAIFVKTPYISPLKTRLANVIGADKAIDFFKLSVASVDEVVEQTVPIDAKLTRFWSIAEKSEVGNIIWSLGQSLWQGGGDLGQKIHQTYQQLISQYDFVILLGGDCPQITSEQLNKVINFMNKSNVSVIGRSEDGGFWIFASNLMIPENIWTSVTYSQSDTTKQLVEKISHLGEVFYVDTLKDVDEFEDLHPCYDSLLKLKEPTVSQKHLIAWLKNNFGSFQ